MPELVNLDTTNSIWFKNPTNNFWEYPEEFNALLLDWLDLNKSEFRKQSSTPGVN